MELNRVETSYLIKIYKMSNATILMLMNGQKGMNSMKPRRLNNRLTLENAMILLLNQIKNFE